MQDSWHKRLRCSKLQRVWLVQFTQAAEQLGVS
jgi:hypothetical protein